VLATGEDTVRELITRRLGALVEITGARGWRKLVDAATGNVIVRVDPRYFRRTEVDQLLGDAGKARDVLGWRPTTRFAALVEEMVASDVAALKAARA
jgi:GDPmannose 4,6-dehydratase